MRGKAKIVVRHEVDAMRQPQVAQQPRSAELRQRRRQASVKLFERIHA